tara:strand:- start:47 stop:247 length:201 start_codon:yes stop_codon:yes gene_type:complete
MSDKKYKLVRITRAQLPSNLTYDEALHYHKIFTEGRADGKVPVYTHINGVKEEWPGIEEKVVIEEE